MTLRLWDVMSGGLLGTLVGHSERVYACAFRPDGRQVASGSIDRTVGLWDLHARPGKHPLHLLRGHTNAVRAVAYAPDEAILASTGYDHTLRLWDVRSGRLLDTLPTNGTTALSVAFDQCGEWLALGAQEQ